MAEHKRVPNLQELDEKEAYTFLTNVFFYGPVPDPEVVYEANHPEDYAMEMTQSGERMVGREHEEIPQGLPRLADYPSAPSAGAGWALGCGGGQRLRWRAGIGHGDDPRAQRRQDMAGQALLRRAV
jgi:hypothetical protein